MNEYSNIIGIISKYQSSNMTPTFKFGLLMIVKIIQWRFGGPYRSWMLSVQYFDFQHKFNHTPKSNLKEIVWVSKLFDKQ